MQDRFKFRVWCENNQEWEKDTILISNKNMYEIRNDKFTKYTNIDPKNHIINFCTGLKDKNGKLIYEGDIVTDVLENKFIVNFSIEYSSFLLTNIKTKGSMVFYPKIKLEVIGNIYENPELLEEQCANQLNRG